VAKAANWLTSHIDLKDDWNSRKARIGDYSEVVRMVRNLVHPASYALEHYRSRVTAKYLKWQFDVVLHCRDGLAVRNNKSLLEHMKADGIMQ
jgi:predicted nuclease of restriction endonuclease-like (RecB) superfamily